MSAKITANEPTDRIDIQLGSSGAAALPPKTVIDVFRTTVEKHGDNAALCYKRPVNVNIVALT
jgi:hypothetical protein